MDTSQRASSGTHAPLLAREERYRCLLGQHAPLTEAAGVQARLKNLGYDCAATGEDLDERARDAPRRFQRDCGLEATGEADETTRELLQQHGV